jgi:nitronate monooxygenase
MTNDMQFGFSDLRCPTPIIQAPMAGVQASALAIAVSNAGAIGSLPCAMLNKEQLVSELKLLNSHAKGLWNVNFFVHKPPTPDAARELDWRNTLAPYYRAFGQDPPPAGGSSREPFSHAIADVVQTFKPPIVSFHFGLPAPDLLQRVRSWGSKVIASATTIEEGLWLQEQGVDAVIAQGLEAGGHRGMFLSDDLSTQLGLIALLPQLVKTLQVPVIAAGGISDANAVRSVLTLGACMAQVGSAYLLAHEATTSTVHRLALQSPAARHTALTNLFTGRPARGIMNRLMKELGPISELAPAFPLATAGMMGLRTFAEQQGNGDFSPLWAGQNGCLAKAGSAAEITAGLAQGALSGQPRQLG